MRHFYSFLILLLLTGQAFCQSTPQTISEKFFSTYKQADSDQAIDYLFSNTPYLKEITEGVDEVKQKLKKVVKQAGVYYGVDLLTTKTAGPNLLMLTYLVKHDRQPLVFNILFYKPNQKWLLQNFKFGTEVDDELEEASKVYRLKENLEY